MPPARHMAGRAGRPTAQRARRTRMTQAPRPNRRVRRDWETTRRRWEAEQRREQQQAAQRRARAEAAEATARRREAAEHARAVAARSWPATPVASRYERRLRARYLSDCERSSDMLPPDRWLAARASRTPAWMVDGDALTGISLAMTVLVTVGVFVHFAVGTDSAIGLWAVVGMVVLSPCGVSPGLDPNVHRPIRLGAHRRDRLRGCRWSARRATASDVGGPPRLPHVGATGAGR